MDAEGPSILAMIAKDIDPKKACAAMGICASSSTFDNVNWMKLFAIVSLISYILVQR